MHARGPYPKEGEFPQTPGIPSTIDADFSHLSGLRNTAQPDTGRDETNPLLELQGIVPPQRAPLVHAHKRYNNTVSFCNTPQQA